MAEEGGSPASRCLCDLPNEILLKILSHLSTTSLLPLGLASVRFQDLSRRVLRGNLLRVVALTDPRIILEAYHPWAQWTEPYLYCTYLGTPGLEADDHRTSTGKQAVTHASYGLASTVLDGNTAQPLPLVCPDARAPPCRPRSLAALVRNVYSRFRPLIPDAMTVTETRHPAGGRMPVRRGNIARAASVSGTSNSNATEDLAYAVFSSSAPSSSISTSLSDATGDDRTAFPIQNLTPANAAALRNAALLTDRLRTTNPTIGPGNHAFANSAAILVQAESERAARAEQAERGSLHRAATSPTQPSASEASSSSPQSSLFGGAEASTPISSISTAASPAQIASALPFVTHRIRLDPDESFSQLVIQTSIFGQEPSRGVFWHLLPINDQGVVRVWRDWMAERAASDDGAEAKEHKKFAADAVHGENNYSGMSPVGATKPDDGPARTLWVDNGRDVGLKVRVRHCETSSEREGEAYELIFEEVLIRTAHLESLVDKHQAGRLQGRSNQSIVFGSFLRESSSL